MTRRACWRAIVSRRSVLWERGSQQVTGHAYAARPAVDVSDLGAGRSNGLLSGQAATPGSDRPYAGVSGIHGAPVVPGAAERHAGTGTGGARRPQAAAPRSTGHALVRLAVQQPPGGGGHAVARVGQRGLSPAGHGDLVGAVLV